MKLDPDTRQNPFRAVLSIVAFLMNNFVYVIISRLLIETLLELELV